MYCIYYQKIINVLIEAPHTSKDIIWYGTRKRPLIFPTVVAQTGTTTTVSRQFEIWTSLRGVRGRFRSFKSTVSSLGSGSLQNVTLYEVVL